MRKVVCPLDDHDHQQLVLLARLNRISVTELVRRIVRAHLDKGKPKLAEEKIG